MIMVQNGDTGITHCTLCKVQFDAPQKFGDIIECEGCNQKYLVNIKE